MGFGSCSIIILPGVTEGWVARVGIAGQGFTGIPTSPSTTLLPSNFSVSFARVVLGCWETNSGWREDGGGTGWHVSASAVLELSTGCGGSCTADCKTGIRDV